MLLAACNGDDDTNGDDASPTPTTTPTPAAANAANGAQNGDGRVAQDGDTVQVHYHGTLDSGEVFDSSREGDPLSFTVGSGQVIQGFDDAVRGLSVGDTKTVRLDPDDAYGQRSDEMIFEVPAAEAPEGLEEGSLVQLPNGAPAVILEVTDETVTVDANHPLAGQALTFEIELVAIN
jgi:FKBP-type peptidyl-prolyl cis-trans isomerase 2